MEWIRAYIKPDTHDLYRAYASHHDMKLYGAYKAAIHKVLDDENLLYVDGKLVERGDK